MTIVTTEDSKKKHRPKPLPKSDQERASAKAQATEKKVKLNAAIKAAIEVIDKIIEDLADEHEITFDHASTMVHLGGRVFKDRRRPSIQNAYRFCLARIEDGRWNVEEHPEKIGVIGIIEKCKQSGSDYKSLSEADQEVLLALLQENRDKRDTGIVGKPSVAQQDIRTSLDHITQKLANLNQRSNFEYFVIGARRDADPFTNSFVCVSTVGGDFIDQYLQFKPLQLAKHFDAYSTNHSRLAGVINVKASENAKGDRKNAMKSLIMEILRRMYRELVNRENPRLDWTKWAKGIPDSSGIVLRGWPLDQPPTALSHIRNKTEMQAILDAIMRKDCRFDRVGVSVDGDASEDTSDDTSFRPGGTILRFNNETEMTVETRSSRKRRTETHSDVRESNKENQPEVAQANSESRSAPRTAKRARIITPSQPSSDQPESVVPPESQLPTEPVPAPAQSCESAAGSIAGNMASVLTLPPTAGPPVIRADDSSLSSPNCLDLLTDRTLVSFPTDVSNTSGGDTFTNTTAA
ncbi:hypothetical protein BGW80DRAFT_1258233 [Lactifluus volemus]|nr:hypothetical protein BGW80DRAFT_1258233 [Lactifluus volemus]